MVRTKEVFSIILLSNSISFIMTSGLICFKFKKSHFTAQFFVFLCFLLCNALFEFFAVVFRPAVKFFTLAAPFGLLYGPFMLLYLKSLNRAQYNFKKYAIHFVIPVFFWLVFFILGSSEHFYNEFGSPYQDFIFLLSGMHLTYYAIGSFIAIFKDKVVLIYQPIKNFMSYLILFNLILASILLSNYFKPDMQSELYFDVNISIHFFVWFQVLALNILLIQFFYKPDSKRFQPKGKLGKEDDYVKYGKSRVESTVLCKNTALLNQVDPSIFMDPRLNLETLATTLGITNGQLSQTFSLELHTSFSKYVNAKRSSYAAMLLENQDFANENLIDIGFRAGFNSKASFYRAFKENYSLSPNEYRKRCQF